MTLRGVRIDQTQERLWESLASLLGYGGGCVTAIELRELYRQTSRAGLALSSLPHPQTDAADICGEALKQCGANAGPQFPSLFARLFRSLSIRRVGLVPESREVLETLRRQNRRD